MATLPPDQFARLLALADALIPEAHGMPSAGRVLADGRLIGRVLALRADLAARLPAVLDRPEARDPVATLDALEREEPKAFDVVFQLVAGAYYLDQDVKRRLSYDGQQPQSLPRAGFGGEDLLETMMAAPKRYRLAPRWPRPR